MFVVDRIGAVKDSEPLGLKVGDMRRHLRSRKAAEKRMGECRDSVEIRYTFRSLLSAIEPGTLVGSFGFAPLDHAGSPSIGVLAKRESRKYERERKGFGLRDAGS